MRLYFTHTNMIFSMGVDGKDKVSKNLELKYGVNQKIQNPILAKNLVHKRWINPRFPFILKSE